MKGAQIKYKGLGKLLREGREHLGVSVESASMMIGITNGSYLARCERGESNFPLAKLRRACDLYKLKSSDVIDRILEDYRKGMLETLKGKK